MLVFDRCEEAEGEYVRSMGLFDRLYVDFYRQLDALIATALAKTAAFEKHWNELNERWIGRSERRHV